jgi:hypothetical protein
MPESKVISNRPLVCFELKADPPSRVYFNTSNAEQIRLACLAFRRQHRFNAFGYDFLK